MGVAYGAGTPRRFQCYWFTRNRPVTVLTCRRVAITLCSSTSPGLWSCSYKRLVVSPGKGSQTGTYALNPGTYTFFCDIPGHRGQGMEGKIVVK